MEGVQDLGFMLIFRDFRGFYGISWEFREYLGILCDFMVFHRISWEKGGPLDPSCEMIHKVMWC